MLKIATKDAVGKALGHDVTKIIPGSFKGVAFRKGHIISKQDVEELLSIGKYSIYVVEIAEGYIHEDEAGVRLARAFAAEDIDLAGPKEGKITFISRMNGLLKVRVDALTRINLVEDVMLSTLHNYTPVEADEQIGATRIIPLTIRESVISQIETMCAREDKIVRVLPYLHKRVGALVTGTEVVEGRIKDGFDESVGMKAGGYGQLVLEKLMARDDPEEISSRIRLLKEHGMDIILITAGLSVDPDDATVLGVKQAGAEIIFYGTPILPGAMFLYARLGETEILGLPACVFFHKTTAFDVFFPRILTGEEITKEQVAALGHGGYCRNCDECRYPKCGFGK